MKIDEIKNKLENLDNALLQDFVLDLYIQFPELKAKIETLILHNDPSALSTTILKRIQSLKRGRKFIDYRLSAAFTRDLQSIIDDIESRLLNASPKRAFDLTDKFLVTANSVFNRVDDSTGGIGEVYSDAVFLWLKAAANWKDANINWVDRVYQLNEDNDFGVLDLLLPNSGLLLNIDQLTQLAWRYESELRKAMKTAVADGECNWAVIKWGVALGSVADALKDPALYERALLIQSPKPSELKKKNIVKMYLKYDQPHEALRWLNTSWIARFQHEQQSLLEKTYEHLGDLKALQKIRYKIYQQAPSFSNFERYLKTLDTDKKEEARQDAVKFAESSSELIHSVDLLIKLEKIDRAEALLLSRHKKLHECYYSQLIGLAKQFDSHNCWLASTACYRSLLLDILSEGRSKAYHYAARYYKKLVLMAIEIEKFNPIDSHVVFLEKLRETHGKKRSFWAKVD